MYDYVHAESTVMTLWASQLHVHTRVGLYMYMYAPSINVQPMHVMKYHTSAQHVAWLADGYAFMYMYVYCACSCVSLYVCVFVTL